MARTATCDQQLGEESTMATINVEGSPQIRARKAPDPDQESDTSRHELDRMALVDDTPEGKRDELGILSLSISPEVEQTPTLEHLFARTVNRRSSP
jgi:hypothetical protein